MGRQLSQIYTPQIHHLFLWRRQVTPGYMTTVFCRYLAAGNKNKRKRSTQSLWNLIHFKPFREFSYTGVCWHLFWNKTTWVACWDRVKETGNHINFVLIKATYKKCEKSGFPNINNKPFQLFLVQQGYISPAVNRLKIVLPLWAILWLSFSILQNHRLSKAGRTFRCSADPAPCSKPG